MLFFCSEPDAGELEAVRLDLQQQVVWRHLHHPLPHVLLHGPHRPLHRGQHTQGLRVRHLVIPRARGLRQGPFRASGL